MQTRVFVVHVPPNLGFRIIQKAREIGMMGEGYVWIFTAGMTNWISSTKQGSSLKNMQGQAGAKVNVFALRAYDSITALAMAVEKTNTKKLQYDNVTGSSNNMTDLGTFGVSRYGPSLLEALSDVQFKGLAGDFKLIDRHLEPSTFEVINVVGNESSIVGSWTPGKGFVNSNKIIWPGNPTIVPKGWDIPLNRKTIKVGVPVKKGFFNFVQVERDPISNKTNATGYAIDIFESALKKLNYLVIPEYCCYESDNNYNDLVNLVTNGTESGVSMIVPLRENEDKNACVFLKPWSLNLWVTTGCFFVLIGFVVWLFEHRVNTDFRGPPHHQIGTSFWFSFSTMVFAHREKVVSNLARFVVVVWCFVVLVLTQSYTASLTSFLTVQRLQPTAINVEDLIRSGESVGYQQGAFVKDILLDLNFSESQLKPFGSAEECDDLLSKGTSKGGIAAAFDEVAYLKAILSLNCSKYAMVEPSFKNVGFEPSFKTAGFGFAFPKNSPMTKDLSIAILKVIQGKEMRRIENQWFNRLSITVSGNVSSASERPDPNADLSSNRLSLGSFWGLFLIAGVARFLAFLVFVSLFLYEHRHTLCNDSEGSMWRKLKSLFRIFNEKDIKSHTFKSSAVHNVSSPITQCTPSHLTVQIRPWPRSMSLNREFELRRACFVMTEERFTTQP
ncbi:hypothetical protein Bca4012_082387 [Brassica carinata]